MRSRLVLIALALVIAAPAAYAGKHFGKQVRYAGVHPVARSAGGGMCYIEVPHVHIYAPTKLEYRLHGDDHVFVGDPVAYGWDGPKYTYKGAHPIHVEAVVGGEPDVEYCYLEGPHYHYFEPAVEADFKVVGDVYFYVGEPPRAMIEARPRYVGINAYYEPLVYERPVVEVEAPVGWIGVRAEFVTPAVVVDAPPPPVVHAPRARAGIHIGVGAEVRIPVPSVRVQIGGPAVIVAPHRHGHGKFKHKHRKFKRH